jgi:single-strand DNA-binding protein
MKGIECAFHGRLGRSPELRTSKAGRPYAVFSVVVALGAEDTQWISVVSFGEAAQSLAGLPTGTSIYVEGTLRLEEFTKKDGSAATALKVSASTAIALGQIGQRRRPAPVKKISKKPDPHAPLGAAGHGGPNDPMPF